MALTYKAEYVVFSDVDDVEEKSPSAETMVIPRRVPQVAQKRRTSASSPILPIRTVRSISNGRSLFKRVEGYQSTFLISKHRMRFANDTTEARFMESYLGNMERYKMGCLMGAAGSLFIIIQSLVARDPIQTTILWLTFCVCLVVFSICAFALERVHASLAYNIAHLLLLFLVVITTACLTIAHLSLAQSYTHPSTFSLVLLGIILLLRPPLLKALWYMIVACIIYCLCYPFFPVKGWNLLAAIARVLEVVIFIGVGVGTTYTTELYFRRLFKHRLEMEQLNERSMLEEERARILLSNVFPHDMVSAIESRVPLSAFSQAYENVSILVSDVVGFTAFSSNISPEQLIRIVDHMFSRYDSCASALNLIKIKTVGDSYIAADLTNPRHMERMADMALSMLSKTRSLNDEHGLDLSIRIGIASGPVVAGIIGYCKFCFDVYGKAINEAIRMENTGSPNRVQCTEDIMYALAGKYLIESQGGRYFVESKCQLSVDDVLNAGNKPLRQSMPIVNTESDKYPMKPLKNAASALLPSYIAPACVALDATNLKPFRDPFEGLYEDEEQVRNKQQWENFTGRSNTVLLRFDDRDVEKEFEDYFYTLDTPNRVRTWTMGVWVFTSLPLLLALVFPSYIISPFFIYMYILAILHWAALLWAMIQEKKKPPEQPTEDWDKMPAVELLPENTIRIKGLSTKSLRRAMLLQNPVAGRMMAAINVNKVKLIGKDVTFMVSSLFILGGCSITIIVQLTIHDIEVGILQTFMIVPLLTYFFHYYFALFWHKLVFAVLYSAALSGCYFYERGDSWRGADLLSAAMGVALTLVSTYHTEKSERNIFVAFKLALVRHAAIQQSVNRSARMLQNTLPKKIINILEEHPTEEIVDNVKNASILFLYLDEKWMQELLGSGEGAFQTFRSFNTVLGTLDSIVSLYPVEKVKTNPYLVVGGCPEPVEDHLLQIQRLALAILSWAQTQDGLSVRIGINVGPICTGIVGENRFVWDVFGDAVNVASRLAQTSEWGKIQVSAEVVQASGPKLNYKQRGLVDLRGKGQFPTSYLIGEKMEGELAWQYVSLS